MTTISRYPSIKAVTSNLDPLQDFLGWIEGLRSLSYSQEIIASKHSKTITDTPARLAHKIVPFIDAGLKFAAQAQSSSTDVAFLPLYYSILNFSKVYIMLGKYRSRLESGHNRQHGVSYNPEGVDTLAITQQKVRLTKSGVLGLLYQTITGEPWLSSPQNIHMGHVYPYMPFSGFEYEMATNKVAKLAYCEFTEESGRLFFRIAESGKPTDNAIVSKMQVLSTGNWELEGGRAVTKKTASNEVELRQLINSSVKQGLIYQISYSANTQEEIVAVPSKPNPILMPLEVSVYLSFFYLSSIARYKPEMLAKMSSSKLWPLLVCFSRHGFFGFLQSFWSFMMQEHYYILRET